MTNTLRPRATRLLPFVSLLFLIPASAPAQAPVRRHSFTGVFAGVEVGRQNLIGGSVVNGVDVLQQASRRVTAASIGARVQAPFGTVFGAELGRGWTDGDLQLQDPAVSLAVEYRNSRQSHWQLTVGQAFGPRRRNLVYIYVSEVSRTFEVRVNQNGAVQPQRDEQGLLRFGVGYERVVIGPVNLRAAIGSSRADFGTQQTNITPRRPLDFSIGVLVAP